ncbi:4-oxalocrotonate tautomerase DmpI [Methanosphaera sp.]|uniref:4-oxalocrotonate tautomerase DmpI n=1 Tax=Methanosphaera sp. TaxID=2666342 RepID=UPI0025DD05F7|nr:4-oxalocrotonate tautomerase DmpI [Methanosphaera sp.]
MGVDNMPVVTVEASKNLSKETKKEMIENVSQVVADTYGLPIQTITMIIRENIPENIGVAGKPVSEE